MPCNCSETNPLPSSTPNCGTCGYQCNNCSCPTDPIIMPEVVCPDPVTCDELYPAECVIYTGSTIQCSNTANTLYPDVLHGVVYSTASIQNRNLPAILQNINNQLCYIYSKEYIETMLTIIKNDEDLSTLFCSIVADCNCDCDLTCAEITYAEYSTEVSPTEDTLRVTFNLPTTSNTPITYIVSAYMLDTGTTYNIEGETTTITTSGNIGTALIDLGASGIPQTNWIVAVQATDSVACVTGVYNETSLDLDQLIEDQSCGYFQYVPEIVPLTCTLPCAINGSISVDPLTFTWTPPIISAASHQATKYTVHWYLRSGALPNNYIYANSQVYTAFTPGTPVITTLTNLGTPIASTKFIVLIYAETAEGTCYAGPVVHLNQYTIFSLKNLDNNGTCNMFRNGISLVNGIYQY